MLDLVSYLAERLRYKYYQVFEVYFVLLFVLFLVCLVIGTTCCLIHDNIINITGLVREDTK